jgi:hypothetical protein
LGIRKIFLIVLASTLISKFDLIDFTFADNDALFALVDAKKLDFAITTKSFDTFDTIYEIVGKIKLIMLGHR